MLSLIIAVGGAIAATSSAPTPSLGLPEYLPLQFAISRTGVYQCLDTPIDGSSQAHASTCLPAGDVQMWSAWPQPDGTYLIAAPTKYACLEVAGHAVDSPVRVASCSIFMNQRWRVRATQEVNAKRAIFWSVSSGHCLGIGPEGARQVACNWDSASAPVWTLFEEGHRLHPSKSTLYQLSVNRGGLCAREVGVWVDLGPCGRAAWKSNRVAMIPMAHDPDQFQLQLASGRCLGGTRSGDFLWASGATCNIHDAIQRWDVARSGNALQVRNQGSGQCLNAKDGASTEGTWLIHWPCAPGSDNARWSFTAELR